MARPSEDMVVEVEDLKSSGGGTETTCSKCIGSDMRKMVLPRVRKVGRLSLDFELYFVKGKPTTDPDWEEWRNGLVLTLGGHTIGGLMGFGGDGQSAHKHFLRFTGQEEKPEPNWFGKQAMQHGKEKEDYAKWYYMNRIRNARIANHALYASESLLYEIVLSGHSTRIGVCITPDMLFKDHLIEIKCPYYNNDQFDYAGMYREDVVKRNCKKYDNLGFNPSWWIQAAFYSLITGKSEFVLLICYYTTRTDRCVFDRYHFNLTPGVKNLLNHELGHIIKCLETPPPHNKKYKPRASKEYIIRVANESQECWCSSLAYYSTLGTGSYLHVDQDENAGFPPVHENFGRIEDDGGTELSE